MIEFERIIVYSNHFIRIYQVTDISEDVDLDQELIDSKTKLLGEYDSNAKAVIGKIQEVATEMELVKSYIKSDIDSLLTSNNAKVMFLKRELYDRYTSAAKNVLDAHSKIFDIVDKSNTRINAKLDDINKVQSLSGDESTFDPVKQVRDVKHFVNRQASEQE